MKSRCNSGQRGDHLSQVNGSKDDSLKKQKRGAFGGYILIDLLLLSYLYHVTDHMASHRP